MSDHQRRYFLVPNTAPLWAAVEKLESDITSAREAVRAFLKKYGGSDAYVSGTGFVEGLDFHENASREGFRQMKAGNWRPNLKTPIGKQISAEIKALPRYDVSGWAVSRALGGSHWADNHVYFTVYERRGGALIVSVHVDAEFAPEGCTQLKTSEYWALRESGEVTA